MIVDPPDDLHDVAGWQSCVEVLKGARPSLPADLYDSMMATLVEGVRYAMTVEEAPTIHGSIRERIMAARATNNP